MSKVADNIENIMNEFNDGLLDNIVDDNTLVFTANDEETIRKAKEERLKEATQKTLIAKKDAQDLVNSAKDLYSKSSTDIDYIKFKANADANSLGKILYQIEVTEEAITTVVNAINEGDTNTNLFKCLTDLQKTMMELLKTKNMYLTTIEDSFKQLTNDVEMSSAVEVESEAEDTVNTVKLKSSRDLMKMIEEAKNQQMNQKNQNITNEKESDNDDE